MGRPGEVTSSDAQAEQLRKLLEAAAERARKLAEAKAQAAEEAKAAALRRHEEVPDSSFSAARADKMLTPPHDPEIDGQMEAYALAAREVADHYSLDITDPEQQAEVHQLMGALAPWVVDASAKLNAGDVEPEALTEEVSTLLASTPKADIASVTQRAKGGAEKPGGNLTIPPNIKEAMKTSGNTTTIPTSRLEPVTINGANVARELLGFKGVIGGYATRPPGQETEHDDGLALDLMVNGAQNPKLTGDALSDFYLKNKEKLGVYYVIWNHQICSAKSNWNWRPYHGTSPHTDHVHVSFNKGASFDSGGLKLPDGTGAPAGGAIPATASTSTGLSSGGGGGSGGGGSSGAGGLPQSGGGGGGPDVNGNPDSGNVDTSPPGSPENGNVVHQVANHFALAGLLEAYLLEDSLDNLLQAIGNAKKMNTDPDFVAFVRSQPGMKGWKPGKGGKQPTKKMRAQFFATQIRDAVKAKGTPATPADLAAITKALLQKYGVQPDPKQNAA